MYEAFGANQAKKLINSPLRDIYSFLKKVKEEGTFMHLLGHMQKVEDLLNTKDKKKYPLLI